MKTFYEILVELQSSACNIAKSEIADDYMDNPRLRGIAHDSIDRAYVLGEIIDSMPVELAERKV
jgi:hypothetical protein